MYLNLNVVIYKNLHDTLFLRSQSIVNILCQLPLSVRSTVFYKGNRIILNKSLSLGVFFLNIELNYFITSDSLSANTNKLEKVNVN